MRHLQGKIIGPITVEEDTALHGTLLGGALVRQATLHVLGTVHGDVVVELDGEAIIRGRVIGTIRNHGQVVVSGIINALIDIGVTSKSILEPRAVIKTLERQSMH